MPDSPRGMAPPGRTVRPMEVGYIRARSPQGAISIIERDSARWVAPKSDTLIGWAPIVNPARPPGRHRVPSSRGLRLGQHPSGLLVPPEMSSRHLHAKGVPIPITGGYNDVLGRMDRSTAPEWGTTVPRLKEHHMRKTLKVLALAGTIFALSAGTAFAASPHQVGQTQVTQSGNSLTIAASIAGLGNVPSATFDTSTERLTCSRSATTAAARTPQRTTSRRPST